MDYGEQRICLIDLVGTPLAVSSKDGQRVHSIVREHIEAGRSVSLDFQGIRNVTSAFLNTAIGQLYGQFDHTRLSELLSVDHMHPAHKALLKDVTQSAKEYFDDPDRHKRLASELIEG